jgi:hypothetical protein
MAELKKKVLGQVSGAVGDIVFRERYGLNYVGLRPNSFMPGTDAASVARRQRFLLTLKTGSSINSIAQLKSLWKGVTPSGLSPFNYIVKTNYKFVAAGILTDLFKIVPDNGFGVSISDNTIDRIKVTAIIDPIETNAGINIVNEPNIMMGGIIFLSSPEDESVGAYSILSLYSAPQVTNLAQQLTFNIFLTNQQQLLFDKYQSYKTFISIITLDSSGSPVHYSSTALLA